MRKILSILILTAAMAVAASARPSIGTVALVQEPDSTEIVTGLAGELPDTTADRTILPDENGAEEGDTILLSDDGRNDGEIAEDAKGSKKKSKTVSAEGDKSKTGKTAKSGKKAGKKGAATDAGDTTVVTSTLEVGDFGEILIENTITGGGTQTSDGQYTDAFLDTVKINKKILINDYTMIGVQYGVSLNRMAFNPTMGQSWLFRPVNFGVMYTRYGKIFGYMPYFGIQVGLFYAQEGYNLDEGYSIEGARVAKFDLLEAQALAHCHFDFWKLKLIVNIGPYVSYRSSIERSGDYTLPPALVNSFLSTDRRWDYGIVGGGGVGLIFDPIEIHLQVMYKYGFGEMYDPSYYSEYYYRFAAVSNLVVSVGVHFQLTRRTGRSTHQIRKEARELYLQRKYGSEE